MTDFNDYTVLLQNNASKEYFRFDKLKNISDSYLYYKFDVTLDVPDGEYTYICFVNNRDDVEYEYKNPVQDTILKIEGEDDIILKDLQPSIGLLRVGDKVPVENVYEEGNEDNTIFYYDN